MTENNISEQEGGASMDQQRTQWETARIHGVCEQLRDESIGSPEDYITPRTESECND